ncbi:hypothetical protein [Serratia symbiotica]|uniref:hypothetical protein n=1 Tax=Serratia symbiotica TaxID=138074 RepID=UPI0030CDA5C1|nr:hypothetical protein [Serratia symbiotica]
MSGLQLIIEKIRCSKSVSAPVSGTKFAAIDPAHLGVERRRQCPVSNARWQDHAGGVLATPKQTKLTTIVAGDSGGGKSVLLNRLTTIMATSANHHLPFVSLTDIRTEYDGHGLTDAIGAAARAAGRGAEHHPAQ